MISIEEKILKIKYSILIRMIYDSVRFHVEDVLPPLEIKDVFERILKANTLRKIQIQHKLLLGDSYEEADINAIKIRKK